MADNVTITPGVGASIAADDISGVLHQRVKISIGAEGAASDMSSANPLPIIGQTFSASATFTPAAASHVAGDVNDTAKEFAFSALSGGRLLITSATLMIASGTAEASAWRLYLYTITPPSALADDAAFLLPSGDRASFIGFIDLGTAVDLGDTQWIETNNINKQVKLTGTSIFGYLVNLTTLTPANVAHTVTLHTVG